MKFLALLASLAAMQAAYANENVTPKKNYLCMTMDEAASHLSKDHGEDVLWTGNKGQQTVVVLTNPQTKTWSIITKSGDTVCLIESGQGYTRRIN